MNNAGQDSLLSKEQGECTISSEQLMEACEQEYQAGYNIGYAKAHEEWKAEAESVTLLLKEVTKLKAERDAAVADLKHYAECGACKYNTVEYSVNGFCVECLVGRTVLKNWEWRGVQEK